MRLEQPTHFVCVTAVFIVPWMIACILESYFVAVLVAALCFVYTLLLVSQLWSLRAELLDESFDATARVWDWHGRQQLVLTGVSRFRV